MYFEKYNNNTFYFSHEEAPKSKPGSAGKSSKKSKSAVYKTPHAYLNLTFKETADTFEKINFRRQFQRRVKANEPDIITIRDVKDVALFQTTSELPKEFIDMFHTHRVDRLLRALIVYMQQYLEVRSLIWRINNSILDNTAIFAVYIRIIS